MRCLLFFPIFPVDIPAAFCERKILDREPAACYNHQAVKQVSFTPSEGTPVTDETVYRTMLFDFYGELLTDKQKEYFDLHYNEDYSLSEIAEMTGISRQGVWDIIKRAEETLRKTEEKTGLIGRFRETQTAIGAIETALEALSARLSGKEKDMALDLAKQLETLKG